MLETFKMFNPSMHEIMDLFKKEIAIYIKKGYSIDLKGTSITAGSIKLKINERNVIEIDTKYKSIRGKCLLSKNKTIFKSSKDVKELISKTLDFIFKKKTIIQFEIPGDDDLMKVREIFVEAKMGILEYARSTKYSQKNTEIKQKTLDHYKKQLDLIILIEKSLKLVN